MEFIQTDQKCQTQLLFAALYNNGKTTIGNIYLYINNTLNIPLSITIIIDAIRRSLRSRAIFCDATIANRVLYDIDKINIHEDLFYREYIPYKVFACDIKNCDKKCDYAHTYNEKTIAVYLTGLVYPATLRSDERFVGNYMISTLELSDKVIHKNIITKNKRKITPDAPSFYSIFPNDTTIPELPKPPLSTRIYKVNTNYANWQKRIEEAEKTATFYKLKLQEEYNKREHNSKHLQKVDAIVNTLREQIESCQIENKVLLNYKHELKLSQDSCQTVKSQLIAYEIELKNLQYHLKDYRERLQCMASGVEILQQKNDEITKRYQTTVTECVKLSMEVQKFHNYLST